MLRRSTFTPAPLHFTLLLCPRLRRSRVVPLHLRSFVTCRSGVPPISPLRYVLPALNLAHVGSLNFPTFTFRCYVRCCCDLPFTIWDYLLLRFRRLRTLPDHAICSYSTQISLFTFYCCYVYVYVCSDLPTRRYHTVVHTVVQLSFPLLLIYTHTAHLPDLPFVLPHIRCWSICSLGYDVRYLCPSTHTTRLIVGYRYHVTIFVTYR